MISMLPLAARLRARLRAVPPLSDAADETAIWSPATTTVERPIIQLPDEVDRIVAFNRTVTREHFLERTRLIERTHPPTIARRYRDATIAFGTVYAGHSFDTVYQTKRRLGWSGTPDALHDRLLATAWTSEQYFGHWLLDGLSAELLAAEQGHRALGLARAPWLQEPQYRALAGMTLERTALARVRDLWLVDDRPMNQGRIDRLRELRRRVRAGARGGPAATAPVFLRRVGGAKRPLLNQDAVADDLARRGFTVLTPERESVGALVSALHGARLVVSVEGSALCHAVAAMADGGTLLAIQPPRRVDWIQKVWADAAGLRLAQTVADDRGEGFEIGTDRLLRLCDLIDRTALT